MSALWQGSSLSLCEKTRNSNEISSDLPPHTPWVLLSVLSRDVRLFSTLELPIVKSVEQVWAYILPPWLGAGQLEFMPMGQKGSPLSIFGWGMSPVCCLCLCTKQKFRVPTLFLCSWNECWKALHEEKKRGCP